mgnify:CR=1 FL=1
MKELLEIIARGLVENPDKSALRLTSPTREVSLYIISTLTKVKWAELSVSRAELQRQSEPLLRHVPLRTGKKFKLILTD